MYNIGDKIVYPMYGAGIIEDFAQRDVDGNKLTYYVMNIPVGNLKIMVSVEKADTLGIRQIHTSQSMLEIIKNAEPIEMNNNWNIRYKENLAKIKSGDITKVTQVYKSLILRERQKGLSSAEKKMLFNAKQIILSELILSQNIEKQQAEQILQDSIA